MENRAHALAAGLFLLLLGAVVAALLLWFRGDHSDRVERLVVAHTGVAGLAVKAPVKLRGVEIGDVRSIAFDPADARRILIRIDVQRSAPLTRATYAQLGYQGVTGLSFIDLCDRGGDPRPLPPGQAIALEPSLLDRFATAGPAILASLGDALQRVQAVLSDANQRRLASALAGADRTLQQLDERSAQLQPVLAALPPLLQHLDAATTQADAALRQARAAAAATTGLAAGLHSRLAALDAVDRAARQVQAAARTFETGLAGPAGLPPEPPALQAFDGLTRHADRALSTVADQPQSLIFGPRREPPGPGEPGFDAGPRGRP